MEQTVSVSKVVIIFTITIRQPFVLFVLCPAPVTGPLTGAKCLLTQWLYYLDIYYPVSRYLEYLEYIHQLNAAMQQLN